MPTKCLRTLGEIRLDVQQQRICLEDVLCFLTSTSAYSAVHQRFTKLAKDGALATLGVALARTPLHAFRGVGGSRTCSTRYIKDPNEFTEIIGELVRHYHSALGKEGRQQGKLAAFWPKVQEFPLNFSPCHRCCSRPDFHNARPSARRQCRRCRRGHVST